MMFLRITIITEQERNQALCKARESLSKSGGWIITHALFSNTAANINFELPLNRVEAFIEQLEGAGLSPKMKSDLPKDGEGDVRGSLVLTFLHDDSNLKRDVPAFG